MSVRDSLDDGVDTNGIYEEGKFTQGGSLASEDLACMKFLQVKHL